MPVTVLPEIKALQERMSKHIVGQEEILEKIMIGLLGNGNLLVEGLPGAAKTRAIKALATNIEGTFGRIQFTPDLISSDITGKEITHYSDDGRPTFKFSPGPVFNNIVLADEINRAPSRTQNALLEAMEERQVTISGVSHKVPDLFMVMATQNPGNQAGTFPLPEAQMDRFLMHVSVDYPDEETEVEIIRLIRSEQSQESRKLANQKVDKKEEVKTSQATIFAARAEIDQIYVPPEIEKYIVDLIFATREPQRFGFELKSYLKIGASPRGTLALDKAARTHAWINGRNSVDVECVRSIVKPVLRHRLGLGDRAREHNVHPDELIDDILGYVEAPTSLTAKTGS